MEGPVDRYYPMYGNIPWQIGIDSSQPLVLAAYTPGVKMDDLPDCVYTCIRPSGSNYRYGLVSNPADGLFKSFLNRIGMRLLLPAVVGCSPIFNARRMAI